MSFTKSEISTHQAVDSTDPGFAIKGYKLRWISGIVDARRAGRMWRVLKLSELPKDIVAEMANKNSSWSDGDTIRRRDLTLAYAPIEQVNERRKMLKDAQNANEAIFKGKAAHGSHVTSKGSSELEGPTSNQYQ